MTTAYSDDTACLAGAMRGRLWPLQARHRLRDNVLCILADAAEQSRAEAVLVTHADEGEARHALYEAAPVQGIAVEPERRKLNPAEVGSEAGAPDDGNDIRIHIAAFEQRQAVVHADRSAPAPEIWVSKGLRRHADERVAGEEPALHEATAKSALYWRAHERRPQPVVDISAEEAAWQRPGIGSRQHDVPSSRGELERDLRAGVTRADHQHVTGGNLRWAAVAA